MYDPFRRGEAPVGVRSAALSDAPGRSPLDLDVWYPADASLRGRDLEEERQDRYEPFPNAPATRQAALRDAPAAEGAAPLVVFSHGAMSHRRSASHLCTHLASHGYVVAAVDHPGSTLADVMADLGAEPGAPRRMDMELATRQRPSEVRFTIDRLLDDAVPELRERIDATHIGTCGVSFGGWTCLAANSIDPRIRACFPIVPAFGKGPLGTSALEEALDLGDWGRPVPTFVLAAERDALIPLAELRRLHAELPEPRRIAVLRNAGHVHFVDGARQRHELLRMQFKSGLMPGGPGIDFEAVADAMAEFDSLCPEAHGAETVRGLCLAHLDAWVKQDADARGFVAGDLEQVWAERGIDLEVR